MTVSHLALPRGGRVPRPRGDEPNAYACVPAPGFVFPARAGMNRSEESRSTKRASVPRPRGDEPRRIAHPRAGKPLRVPRPRGDEPTSPRPGQDPPAEPPRPHVFPARAGMNRTWSRNYIGHWQVFPARAGMNRTPVGGTGDRYHVFPARAGMNRRRPRRRIGSRSCSPPARG